MIFLANLTYCMHKYANRILNPCKPVITNVKSGCCLKPTLIQSKTFSPFHRHIFWDKMLEGTLHVECKQTVNYVLLIEDGNCSNRVSLKRTLACRINTIQLIPLNLLQTFHNYVCLFINPASRVS